VLGHREFGHRRREHHPEPLESTVQSFREQRKVASGGR